MSQFVVQSGELLTEEQIKQEINKYIEKNQSYLLEIDYSKIQPLIINGIIALDPLSYNMTGKAKADREKMIKRILKSAPNFEKLKEKKEEVNKKVSKLNNDLNRLIREEELALQNKADKNYFERERVKHHGDVSEITQPIWKCTSYEASEKITMSELISFLDSKEDKEIDKIKLNDIIKMRRTNREKEMESWKHYQREIQGSGGGGGEAKGAHTRDPLDYTSTDTWMKRLYNSDPSKAPESMQMEQRLKELAKKTRKGGRRKKYRRKTKRKRRKRKKTRRKKRKGGTKTRRRKIMMGCRKNKN